MLRIPLVLTAAFLITFFSCKDKTRDPEPDPNGAVDSSFKEKAVGKWALEKTVRHSTSGEIRETFAGEYHDEEKDVTLSCNDSPYNFTYTDRSGVNFDTLTLYSTGAVNWHISTTSTSYSFSNDENTGCTHEVITNDNTSVMSGFWTTNTQNELILTGSFNNSSSSRTSTMKIEQVNDSEMILSAVRTSGVKVYSHYSAQPF
ncbi:hypothetical protein RCC89_11970 [Cytophagaceae bacterium ABcell3]|nr:hypothetical protein RCC89_11970 [Cytophagaceae bacterium ABcell3]